MGVVTLHGDIKRAVPVIVDNTDTINEVNATAIDCPRVDITIGTGKTATLRTEDIPIIPFDRTIKTNAAIMPELRSRSTLAVARNLQNIHFAVVIPVDCNRPATVKAVAQADSITQLPGPVSFIIKDLAFFVAMPTVMIFGKEQIHITITIIVGPCHGNGIFIVVRTNSLISAIAVTRQ